MSEVVSLNLSTKPAQVRRSHLWFSAAISPFLIAPVWLALPEEILGPFHGMRGLVLLLLIACASWTDLSRRKIFNWTTYTAFLWAIALNLLPQPFSNSAIGLSASLTGGAVCFALMLVPYSLARGGAGDVKLAAAIGALVGVGDGLLIIAFTYIIAAATIIAWTVVNQGPMNLFVAAFKRIGSHWLPQYVSSPSKEQGLLLDQPVPLAGFFAVAVLMIQFDVPALLRSMQ